MKLLPLSILLLAPLSATASYCQRLPITPEFPAGLGGTYELIGREPVTGQAYAGTLIVGYGKTTYTLTRTVAGASVNGDAWIERCGMDKIMALVVRYYTKPMTQLSCSLDADGDNYNRATCKVWQGARAKGGLEAWFQKP
jgi:hypothetical protein